MTAGLDETAGRFWFACGWNKESNSPLTLLQLCVRSVRGTETRGVTRLRSKQGPRRVFFFFLCDWRATEQGNIRSCVPPQRAGSSSSHSVTFSMKEECLGSMSFFFFGTVCECAALLRPCSVVTGSDSALAVVHTEERKDGNAAWRGRRRRPDGAESEKLALIVLASHSQPPRPTLLGWPGLPRIARRHLTDEVGA